MLHFILSVLIINFSIFAWAAEESLDLEKENLPAPTVSAPAQKFSIMGRVDLSLEYGNPSTTDNLNTRNLKNNHILFFLKVKASEKVSVMGEFVNSSFVSLDYATQLATVQFGKIIVPFGDTRHFHHFYGGIQGYGSTGAMLKNIWAEPGMNINWHSSVAEIDTYVVNSNSINATSATTDPGLQNTSAAANSQALGLRTQFSLGKNVSGILSGYYGDYWPGKNILLAGADIYSNYRAWDFGFFSYLRWSMGTATAAFKDTPVSGDLTKQGDYIEIATNYLPYGEFRIRYGTYIDNTKLTSNKDTHNLNVGYIFNVDAVKVLVENQWNYEAVNEYNNDVFRIMASVDF